MGYRVKRVDRDEDRARAYALRHEVFVVEQAVPEDLERDEQDDRADHVIAEDAAGRLVATGRLVDLDGRVGKVGRMAVSRSERGRGAGAAVLAELERLAREKGMSEILLHAQLTARGFYDQAGYLAEGAEFEEAGIGHVAMRKRLAR
ncbi:MAG TPA: GNAT family N-acetyltransferase [Anaeromyxobacteraceae bacterium]|nr:GNAT family N-acetyltransferase [Anaeromyxobacteraceae bacterium]